MTQQVYYNYGYDDFMSGNFVDLALTDDQRRQMLEQRTVEPQTEAFNPETQAEARRTAQKSLARAVLGPRRSRWK